MDGETEEPAGCSVGNIVKEPSQSNDNTDRFDFSITSQDLSKYMEGETPANTKKYTLGCQEF